MKTIRNIAAIAVIAASLTACGNTENKSIGGSADTTTTKNASDQGVSSVGGVDSTTANKAGQDSMNSTEGNASPTGRP
jgi:hypothetical protein